MEKSELLVRRYKTSDHQQIKELHKLALMQFGANIMIGHLEDDLDQIEEVYLKNGEFLVMEYQGKIIGMGGLRDLNGIGEIKRMRIHPDFQGQGIGQMLLTLLENKVKEMGSKTIRLDTTAKQIVAQNLYIKNGYKETGRRRIDSIDTDQIHFEKDLN